MAASSSSGSGNRLTSIVDDIGMYNSGCGYCNSGLRSSVSHGLSVYALTVDDYQELLDRGWRRSGTHLYKPDGDHTCCPVYTIRLEADEFIPSKDQKRVVRRVQRYLDGYERQQVSESEENGVLRVSPSDEVALGISSAIRSVALDWIGGLQIGAKFELPEITVRRVAEKLKKQLKTEAQYTSNAAFLVSAQLKRIRRQEPGLPIADFPAATVAETLASRLQGAGVVALACKGHLNFETSGLKAVEEDDIPAAARKNDRCQPLVQTGTRKRLELSMKRSSFDPEEFELYKRYQVAVHDEDPADIRESSYRRFLVDSPLIPSQDGSVAYGSYHQQYRIDGRLVAVGVVDILPRCLSSKYLIWDPDFAFLSLGKFSVLKEIEWVQNARRTNPQLRYYYLGYYIHSCPKMRYKAAYYPSQLLCPVKFEWVPFQSARPLLPLGGSVCIANAPVTFTGTDTEIVDGECSQDEDRSDMQEMIPEENGYEAMDIRPRGEIDPDVAEALGEIPVMVNGRCWKFKYLAASDVFPPAVLRILKHRLYDYWRLVGTELASRIIYNLRSQ